MERKRKRSERAALSLLLFALFFFPFSARALSFPEALTIIGEEAFAGVAAQKIIVPEGVTTIESRAFAGCPNLVEIELPTGIGNFAGDAFAKCTHQVKVYGPADSYLAFYADHVDNLVLEPTD